MSKAARPLHCSKGAVEGSARGTAAGRRKPSRDFFGFRQAHSMGSADSEMQAHYAHGKEWDRLGDPKCAVEFERTKEILRPRLPAVPAVIADIGGGRGGMCCGWPTWVTQWSIEILCVRMWSNSKRRAGLWFTPKLAMLAT
jgi:hypothetical protein